MENEKQFATVKNGLLVRAPAKVNLSLLIAGKRKDGFHEIKTVMAKVNWYDEILIQKNPKKGIELLTKGAHRVPQGEKNLVYQAGKMLLQTAAEDADIKITLTKNIPAGTGLGSASSDAAATLLGVKRFLHISVKKPQLHAIAEKLGSDVPFFLDGPLALCTGKGENIKQITENFNFLAVLIIPDVTVSTKRVYNSYVHDQALYQTLNRKINAYIKKNRIDLTAGMCANMLQRTCFGLREKLAELKYEIESLGIGPLCLSGSGSAMFCIVENANRQKAVEYQQIITEKTSCKSVIVSKNRW
ncbi:MAG: 4-(cytidine 5'-diphospho)-2-C-methyl-D-erythritol kinase [Planctomycetota bacterium]|jgi:4-diphosphocytidyl-2-C-methyl-D-erythritol kinase